MIRPSHNYVPVSAIGIALFLTCLLPGLASAAAKPDSPASKASNRVSVDYGKLPLSFEPNLGQTAKEVQWLARGPEYTLFLTGPDAVLQLNAISPAFNPGESQKISSSALRMNLIGAKILDGESGQEPQSGKANYLTGNDPSKWQKNVPMYGKVRMSGVYPGIDLVYYGHQGQLEYDFVVAPGADPSSILLSFDGANATLATNGDLVLPINGGGPEVRFHKPVVYQIQDGVRQPVDGSFVIAKDQKVKFSLGAYDKSRELVIDPTLTYLGVIASGQGNQSSIPDSMAVDSNGEIVVTGSTSDNTFPVTTGALQTVCDVYSSFAKQTVNRCPGGGSAFVTKISADGTSLIFSTYLHGISGYEYGKAVAIDSQGNEVILGGTSSYDFPITTDAYQSICQPIWNGTGPVQICDGFFSGGGTEYAINGPVMFVAKLDPTGANLLYGTFVGGTAVVDPSGLALDSNDNIYFTGFVQAAWPASGAYPASGYNNIQFPTTTSAFQSEGSGEQAATLSVMSSGGEMMYSTFFGTTDTTGGNVGYAQPNALAVGPNGMAYIGGQTTSSGLPTTPGALKPNCVANPAPNPSACIADTGWLAAFDTTQSGAASLVYATYIGGTELSEGNNTENQVMGLHADSANNLFVTGATNNIDFPTTAGVYQATCNHANNAHTCDTGFLMKFSSTGALTWSSFYGGTNASQTVPQAITLDAKGQVYLYGYNNGYSVDLPLVNPIEADNGSTFDFVATFTSDAKHLLFATPFFESCCSSYAVNAISNNGVALDSAGNVYVAGYGNDWGALVTTPGTYATVGNGSGWRTYFAKISPVLDPSAATLTISPSTAIFDHTVTFTATVAGTVVTTPTPTGRVTLVNSSTDTTLGEITLGANGSGKFTSSSLPGGSYSVTATYSGDSNYQVVTSTAQTLTVNPTNQTITFTPPPTQTYGAAPLALTATASSGLTVSFASTTPTVCTVSGSTVTLLSGGADCTIQASQAGNSDYNAALKVAGSFLVHVEHQTITFGALPARIYGSAPFGAIATASSGLPVSFASTTTPVCTVSGSTVTLVEVGTCTIKASQAGNNQYGLAAAVSQSFAINQAAQTITFTPPATQTYGAAPFALTATASSGLAVSFASTTPTVCTVSGSMVTLLSGGADCTIRASRAGNIDYKAATTVAASFLVHVEHQTITFGTLPARIYGAAPFGISATASSGLPVSFASTTTPVCTVSGSTVTLVEVGTCTIKATQAGNNQYGLAAAVSQSFAVNKAAQTITFTPPATQTYGAAPFALTATASSGLTVSFASTTPTVCTVSGSTVTLLSGGADCTIQASQAGNIDYKAATTVTGSFLVHVEHQTITFVGPPSTPLSAGSVSLSAAASSGLAVTFTSTTTGVCTVSGTTATLVSAGACTIKASQAGNDQYAVAASVTQSFTVTAN